MAQSWREEEKPLSTSALSILKTLVKPELPEDLCKQILAFDKSIRFAGIADQFGKIIMSEQRKGTQMLLSAQETTLSVLQSTVRMGTRKTDLPKLGKIVYALALYEKVKRATVPLGHNYVLLVSFDTHSDHEPVILKKIMPLMQKHGLH